MVLVLYRTLLFFALDHTSTKNSPHIAMFGTEMHLVTFIFTVLNILFLYAQFTLWIISKRERSKRRFLILLLVFLYYNLTNGLFPDENFVIPVYLQVIISITSGICLGILLYNYLTRELDVAIGFYTTKRLAIILFGSFAATFVLITFATNDLYLARKVFALFPIAVSFSFAFNAIKNIKKQYLASKEPSSKLFRLLSYSSYISLLGLCAFSITFGIGVHQAVEASILNAMLILNVVTYTYREINQSKVEQRLLTGSYSLNGNRYATSNLKDVLSTREMEVCFFLFQGDETYESIGNRMFITAKTVSKHASNIFKKTHTKSRTDFVNKFRVN